MGQEAMAKQRLRSICDWEKKCLYKINIKINKHFKSLNLVVWSVKLTW